MHDTGDTLVLILVGILAIVVWAGIVVGTKLPKIEMLTRGVYEELKRVYDELERNNRGLMQSQAICRGCGKPLAGNERFCGECGQPAGQMAATA